MSIDVAAVPQDRLKAAITSLNSILDTGKINVVGKKHAEKVSMFKAKVDEFVEKDQVEDLPDDVVDFFNEFMAEEEESKEEKKEPKKEEKKSTGKKTFTKKAADKTKTEEKASGKSEEKTTGKKKVKFSESKKSARRGSSESVREYSVFKAIEIGGTFAEIAQKSDDLYVEGGGLTNLDQATKLLRKAVKLFTAADLLEFDGDKISYKG